MKVNRLSTGNRRLVGLLIICIGLGLLLLTLPVQAGSELPPRGDSDKPPADNGGGGQDGAYIEFHWSSPMPDQYWTAVQWQDGHGNWHDVEGWRNWLSDNGTQRWWVAPKDFGTGPFRWSVYQGEGGFLVEASGPFRLPTEANTSVMVTLGDVAGSISKNQSSLH